MSEDKIKKVIQSVVESMMDRIMTRVLIEDPFLAEEHRAKKPLYAALVPDEIFKGSHFERRFVTPFGGAWEKLAIVVAESVGCTAYRGHTINGNINAERLRRIQEILNELEHGVTKDNRKIKPDWQRELDYVLSGESYEMIPSSVLCDVYIETSEGKNYAFEVKAPLPNSDQTKVSKEKILKLYAMENSVIDGAYYALPYNPYGKKRDYAWAFPARWFNMTEDSVVLIGREFWDFIGGKGTYDAFISAVNEIGDEYKQRIYKEYLGIQEFPRNEDGSLK